MKKVTYTSLLTTILLCLAATMSCSQANKNEEKDKSVFGIYVGDSPCADVAKPLLKIPGSKDCERIQWRLTLYKDAASDKPTRYELHCTYGMAAQGKPGFTNDSGVVKVTGMWTIVKGTKAKPDATVYQLEPANASASLSFVKLDENILHLLYRDKTLMIGNGGWSYTLNRKTE